jgi:DNA-binding XRE family transcriptional regulator
LSTESFVLFARLRLTKLIPQFVTYSPLPYNPHGINIFLGDYMEQTIQIKVGQRIKEMRNKMSISQEKFALSIEMDRTYLASVEAGKRNISIANLYKIANGLNISLSELFDGL